MRARFRQLVEEKGLDAALLEPVHRKQDRQLATFLFGADRKAAADEAVDTAAIAALTFGDVIFDVASIDPRVVNATDFAHSDDVSDVFKFSRFAERLQDTKGDTLVGAKARLSGYVAEQVVATKLVEQGQQVELPDSPNQPGFDLIVDGEEFQVKCLGGIQGLHEHFAAYPDINPDNSRVLTNEKPPCGKKLLRANFPPHQRLSHVQAYHDTVFVVP